MQTLGSPGKMRNPAQSGTGTAQSEAQGVHIVHTLFCVPAAGPNGMKTSRPRPVPSASQSENAMARQHTSFSFNVLSDSRVVIAAVTSFNYLMAGQAETDMTNREAIPSLWRHWISHCEGCSIARHHTNLELSLARCCCRIKLVGNDHLRQTRKFCDSSDSSRQKVFYRRPAVLAKDVKGRS